MAYDPKRPHYYGGPDVLADPDEYSEAHGLNSRQRDVIKYVTRARKKGQAISDYRKAIHWIEREIALIGEDCLRSAAK